MSRAGTTTLWARALVDELARAGVREVAVAPGSRSTPLVLAFARDGRFRMRVHLDERSAAFFALGVGKSSGIPAVVLTTSGTAVANLLPAVVEADLAEAPLLAVTADRPPRLRGADANQTIEQPGLFGRAVRAAYDLPEASADRRPLRHLRTLVCRAVAEAAGPPAGPVHLNVPLEKPLEPDDAAAELLAAASEAEAGETLGPRGRPDGRPFTGVTRARTVPGGDELRALAASLRTPRGVVVAGPVPDPVRTGPAVRAFAARAGFPLLADALSGARFGLGDGEAVAGHDLLLRDPEVRRALRPSLVVRVGRTPTSAALADWLEEHRTCRSLVIDDGSRWKDHEARATDYVRADPAETLDALLPLLPEEPDVGSWGALWRDLDRVVRDVVEEDDERTHEGAVWPALADTLEEATIFVSSSMPVRDLDAFGLPGRRRWTVHANRGASGIDGIVSTAYGVAAGSGSPVVCVLGDLAFFHDQNGLLWARERDLPVVFLLIDNDGGGIFHRLPVARHEPWFTRYFATPHGLDLAHAARMHGLEVRDASPAEAGRAVADALAAGRSNVIRVRTRRDETHLRAAVLAGEVRRRALAVLGARPDPVAGPRPSDEQPTHHPHPQETPVE